MYILYVQNMTRRYLQRVEGLTVDPKRNGWCAKHLL